MFLCARAIVRFSAWWTQVQAHSSHYVNTLFCKMLPIRSYFQIQRKDFPNFKNNHSCLFSPFNKTHHESSLIFLNASMKTVKPLLTAPARKDPFPLFIRWTGIFPGASAWSQRQTVWIWLTASLPLALLPKFKHLIYWELSVNNKQVSSKDVLVILFQ